MGKQPQYGADGPAASPACEHDGESAHAMSGTARIEAPAHRPERQSGESDRGGPGLERDPYRDEGGEA
jgi:hypothetical protein